MAAFLLKIDNKSRKIVSKMASTSTKVRMNNSSMQTTGVLFNTNNSNQSSANHRASNFSEQLLDFEHPTNL